jgi:Tfp pilus assembly protein PilX
MEHPKLKSCRLRKRNSGVALILVLMLVVLTTIVMLAFFLSVQTESKSMRSAVSGQGSRQLADIAVQSVISQIQQATTQGSKIAWASQPGMIRCYDSTGKATAWYKLYSSSTNVVTNPTEAFSLVTTDLPSSTGNWATPGSPNYGVYTDINSPVYSADGSTNYPVVNPAGATSINTTNPVQGFDITTSTTTPGAISTPGYSSTSPTSPSNNPAAMPVRWLYVLQNGAIATPVNGGSGTVTFDPTIAANVPTASNPIVGRIAYWTDDETCKLNVNTAADGTYFDTPRFCSVAANTSNLPNVSPPAQDADIVIDRQMALTPPVAGEYQRYVGNPAQTRLTYALGLPIANSGIVNKSNLMTLLSPFMQWGGSDGGTLTTWNGSISNTLGVPQRQTPYASLDEWMFSNQQLQSDNRVPNPGTLAANPPPLLTNTNLQQLRFFLSANSDAPEVNLFGQPRISMWPEYTPTLASNILPALPSNYITTFDQLIANAASLAPSGGSPFTYYFGRQNAASPTVDWGSSTMSLTSPTSNTRNQNLFIFLRTLAKTNVPGYGVNFDSKYSSGEMDQILTEIFDYCRCLDPADALVTTPYAATGQSAAPSIASGGAQVTPITISQTNFGNLYSTKGIGRFDTIDQVSLDFTKSEAGAYNSDGTTDTTHVNIAGLIYLSLYSPSEGYVSLNPHLRIVVQSPGTSGVITMNLTGSNGVNYPVFGSPYNNSTASGNSGRTVFSVIPLPPSSGGNYGWNNGANTSLTWGGVAGARQLLLGKQSNMSNKITYSNGNIVSGIPVYNNGNYELCGLNIKIPTTCTSLTMAATQLEIKIYHTDALPSSTTTANGGDGYPSPNTDPLIQDIIVQFPGFTQLPMPSNFTFEAWKNSQEVTYDLGTRLSSAGYCLSTYPLSTSNPSSTGLHVPGIFIESGDIVQSLVAGYNGDSRLIAAQQTINDTANSGALANAPSPAFVPHPLYNQAGVPNAGLAMAHSQLDIFPHYSQPGYTIPSPTVSGTTGQLVPTATYGSVIPATGSINPSFIGTKYVDPSLTGDWDNGWGGFSDGPFINKADEAGSQYESSQGTYGSDPYYNGEGSSPYTSLSSPNRSVASPVMFGSLPTGVPLGKWSGTTYTPYATVQGPLGQAIPWQTLLFRPQPSHYGSSNGGTTIEDEELLDWFWMPVVEPYAISTTLATAGKVNMNYQIAPFIYITRATALMGVLGSEYVISAPTAKGQTYKTDGGSTYPTYRSPVKVLKTDGITYDDDDGTLRQFRDRFANGLIFKSAAEICDIYLEPTTDPTTGAAVSWGSGSTPGVSTSYITAAQTYWASNQLTGDNTRERPYNGLYSRLTTKSNTYTVHVRAQTLTSPVNGTPGQWVENPQLITSEYRGSVTINRYIDPQDPNIPDFMSGTLLKYSLDNYYKYRVLETRRFLP